MESVHFSALKEKKKKQYFIRFASDCFHPKKKFQKKHYSPGKELEYLKKQHGIFRQPILVKLIDFLMLFYYSFIFFLNFKTQ